MRLENASPTSLAIQRRRRICFSSCLWHFIGETRFLFKVLSLPECPLQSVIFFYERNNKLCATTFFIGNFHLSPQGFVLLEAIIAVGGVKPISPFRISTINHSYSHRTRMQVTERCMFVTGSIR